MTESNRIEFKRELTDEPRVSIPRNKELMRIFRDVEMVESLGSGMPRIMEVYGRECFSFMEHFIRFTVPFYRDVTDEVGDGNGVDSQKHVEENEVEHVEKKQKHVEKEEKYVEKDEKHVEKTSELILEIIRKEPSITMTELAKRTGLVRRSIEDQINRLKRKNLIRRVGSRKYGHWEIIEEASDN